MEDKSFTNTGEFVNADKFEKIWIEQNVRRNYGAENKLPDNEYLDYHIWEDINFEKMYAKHMPETVVFRGKNPNIIFHGGCLGCLSQRLHGFDRCFGCGYFKFTNKPNLYIPGEDAARLGQDDLNKLFGED